MCACKHIRLECVDPVEARLCRDSECLFTNALSTLSEAAKLRGVGREGRREGGREGGREGSDLLHEGEVLKA